jgi:hypothetical protein
MRLRVHVRLLAIVASLMLVGGSSNSAGEQGSYVASIDLVARGGGLNRCGCHFNRKDRRVSLPPSARMRL